MLFSPAALVANIRRLFLVIGVSALCGILMAGLALPVVGALGLGARESAQAFREMDFDFEPGQLSETSEVVDESGRLLATFFEENREYVELEDIADVMVDATLAIEDDRFFERGPIDFRGTLRALIRNLEAGETQEGGSTLTQQYVKQVRLSQAETAEERSEVLASTGVEGYRRKLEELRMAVSVEQEYTKEEILERYLNIAYFGSRAYGIEAAAQTYFSTSADELTVRQAALLAGIVQSPSQYDPTRSTEAAEAALGRRNVVLNRMAETGKISEDEAAEIRQTDLGLDPAEVNNGCVSSWAGYFCDYVVHEIRNMEELGETPEDREYALYNGGLRVEVSIDEEAQEAAEEAIADYVSPTDEAVGSLASVEPGTGYIRAIANSREYGVEGDGVSNINYAVNKDMGGGNGMQPGSAFKTWVLAAAVNQGISLNTSIESPAQITLAEDSFSTCEGTYRSNGTWDPSNYDNRGGTFNLRTATERSVNTFYAQLTQRTGLCEPTRIAQEAGVVRADNGGDLRQVPSFSLGVNEVSPLAMAGGYAMFANRGEFCEPTAVLTVEDRNGDVIVDNTEPDCERVLEEPVADAVASVLEGVVHNPGATGSRMQLAGGRPAAGKTGTTNDAVSVWWVGFVPQLSTAVAVADVDGGDDGQLRSLRELSFNGERVNPCGGCIPGPIWKQMMDETLDGEPVEEFEEPDSSVIEGVDTSVPDVRGMSTAQATQTLEDAGFSASVTARVNSDLPEGRVVRTDPGAGASAPSGITVRLFVSNGTPPGDDEDEDDEDGDEDDEDRRVPEDPDESLPPVPDPNDRGNQGGQQDGDGDDEDDDGWT